MEDGDFAIRTPSPKETEEAFIHLVQIGGWDKSLVKFKAIRDEFSSHVFVTINKKTNEIVGVVSVIPTSPGQCVVGTLVVREDCRHQGIGGMMLERVKLRHPTDTLTLTALPGVDPFYRKHGFNAVEPSHHVFIITVDRVKVATACSKLPTYGFTVKSFTPDLFQAVNDFDTSSRGYDGRRYLSVMTGTSDAFLVAISPDAQVVGYAAGNDCSSILWVDGLFADTDSIALLLFRELLDGYPEKKEVRVQTIKPREFLVQFGDVTWSKSRVYTRMATGDTAPFILGKLYAVSDCDYSE